MFRLKKKMLWLVWLWQHYINKVYVKPGRRASKNTDCANEAGYHRKTTTMYLVKLFYNFNKRFV